MPVFEIISKIEKKIRLTEMQWAHIVYKHPEMENQLEKMILTLIIPDLVYYSPREENYQYYKYFDETPITKKYLLVIVKHLNDEGFIITSFFISKIKRFTKEVVYGKEDIYKL